MTNFRRFLTFSTFLALSTGAAYAQPFTAGDYKLAVGNSVPCTVNLAADGSASVGACATAPNVAHWQQHGSTLQLSTVNGEVYALLKPKGDVYAGTTFVTNSSLTLTPTAQTAALTH